jgi:hypothetical protein
MKTALLQIVDNMITQIFSEDFISLFVTKVLGVTVVYVSNCFLGIKIEIKMDHSTHTTSIQCTSAMCFVFL